MADQIKILSAGHSIEVLDAIMTEVEEARGEHDNLGERLDEMSSDTPTPSTAAPAMDGTASAGTSTDYARADHVHPSDTSKQDALTAAQLAAANSGINSEKVAQIESNKNNILSLYNQNGKTFNILDLNNIALKKSDIVCTVDNTIGRVIASCPSTTYQRILWNIPTVRSIAYRLEFDVTAFNSAVMIYPTRGTDAASAPYGQIDVVTTGHYAMNFTPDVDTLYLALYLATEPAKSNSITIDNMRITPMSAYNAGFDDFQPYAPSNAELYAMIQALQAQLNQ